MILAAARRTGMSSEIKVTAILAVKVARTPALTPEPSPSDNAVTIRPSEVLRERKVSPSVPCPYFRVW